MVFCRSLDEEPMPPPLLPPLLRKRSQCVARKSIRLGVFGIRFIGVEIYNQRVLTRRQVREPLKLPNGCAIFKKRAFLANYAFVVVKSRMVIKTKKHGNKIFALHYFQIFNLRKNTLKKLFLQFELKTTKRY